ncbi:polysaccharide deacetylase family sporulation protein PdaB [Halobacillus karajensis]|uniref:polysaccharide deacetylase family protein n=1 Tax=Halobacillus karajensis TaxID=195088 RepID=UPI0008A795A4|nr:polysaccharide deacetylase family protein [Halobacillus karajensis]SEI04344.1 polysaccharide deacetylase family sporulation protein PdaB [Halobacillus karajensis]
MLKKIAGFIVFISICALLSGKTAMAEVYEVKPEDTLATISDEYGIPEDKIVNKNKLLSTALWPGQQLEIPSKSGFDEIKAPFLTTSKLSSSLPELFIGPRVSLAKLISNSLDNEMIYMGNTDKKRIALTFDDGPEDTYTPQILEILKQKNVKATFFVMGERVTEYPERLKQIHEEGHVIGNHTWDHPHLPELSDQQMHENIKATSAEIEKVTGVKPDLFRPPFGEIEDRQAALLSGQGYRSILWTADSRDWEGLPAEEIVSRVKQDARPGVIALQHNYHASGPFETVEALPQIIDELRAEGYEFVTVPKLLDAKGSHSKINAFQKINAMNH